MVTSERRKKPPVTFNCGGKQLGFFDTQGKGANQVSSIETNVKNHKDV